MPSLAVRLNSAACLLLIASGAALPLAAHHNQAVDFNINQPMTFKGVVTKVEWMNPHAFLHMDITDSDGKVNSWLVMLSSPNSLKRQGVTKDSFMPGETIVDVIAAKDGSHIADGKWGGTLILPNGVRAVLPSWTAQALLRGQKK